VRTLLPNRRDHTSPTVRVQQESAQIFATGDWGVRQTEHAVCHRRLSLPIAIEVPPECACKQRTQWYHTCSSGTRICRGYRLPFRGADVCNPLAATVCAAVAPRVCGPFPTIDGLIVTTVDGPIVATVDGPIVATVDGPIAATVEGPAAATVDGPLAATVDGSTTAIVYGAIVAPAYMLVAATASWMRAGSLPTSSSHVAAYSPSPLSIP